jgi:hypothetical protein
MKYASSRPTSLVFAVAWVYKGKEPPAQSTTTMFQSACLTSSFRISCKAQELKPRRTLRPSGSYLYHVIQQVYLFLFVVHLTTLPVAQTT